MNIIIIYYCINFSVRDWGPLHMNNSFPFENGNRIALKLKHSPTHIALQISRNFLLMRSLLNFTSSSTIDPEVAQFCSTLFQNRVKFSSKVDNCTLIGQGKEYNLEPKEMILLKDVGSNQTFIKYEKIIKDGRRYTSIEYDRCQKKCDHFFQTVSGVFGIIYKILLITRSTNNHIIIIYKPIDVKKNLIENEDITISHIKECDDPYTSKAKLQYCDAREIKQPCMFMRRKNSCFISCISKESLSD